MSKPPALNHRLSTRATRLTRVLLALALCTPLWAHAWWNDAWPQRTRITLDTTDKGVPLAEPVAGAAVAVRLHSGNFDFTAAKPDGSDLRVVAADDKTPLRFRVERFDGVNELAVLWVQWPSVLPGSDKNALHVYAGNPQATAEAAADVLDAAMLAAVHFDDAERLGRAARGRVQLAAAHNPETNALLAGGARLDGTALVWPAADAVKVDAGGAATVSLWIKPEAADAGTLLAWGPLQLVVQAGKLGARLGTARADGGELRAGTWNHVAVTLSGGKLRLYVGGAEVAQADAATPALSGPWSVGQGLRGAVDEVQLASTARSAAWLKLAAAAEGTEGRLVRATKEGRDQPAEGASPGYMGILVKNLTIDAWVVIVILAGMFVLACWVMVDKLTFIGRADKDNRRFLARFRDSGESVLTLRDANAHPNSSLYRLYLAGLRELERRKVGDQASPPLSGASLDAVKASVDADLVRESHRLNNGMVWLTIAISGGPFLGLLGTVVGVMITFAAIAAAGDVNINAIAPGIAAALLATVAGLAVAIPALFGYNYLATRIRNLSADMQIFVDEFITRVAEQYGAR